MPDARYERIGHGYARTRREDPALRDRILAELGDSRTVLNVGAGAGSHEPRDRHVIAIEPSDVMAAQRPADLAHGKRRDRFAVAPVDPEAVPGQHDEHDEPRENAGAKQVIDADLGHDAIENQWQ